MVHGTKQNYTRGGDMNFMSYTENARSLIVLLFTCCLIGSIEGFHAGLLIFVLIITQRRRGPWI